MTFEDTRKTLGRALLEHPDRWVICDPPTGLMRLCSEDEEFTGSILERSNFVARLGSTPNVAAMTALVGGWLSAVVESVGDGGVAMPTPPSNSPPGHLVVVVARWTPETKEHFAALQLAIVCVDSAILGPFGEASAAVN